MLHQWIGRFPFRGFLFVCAVYTFGIIAQYQTYIANWDYAEWIPDDEQAAYIISLFGIMLSAWDFFCVRRNPRLRWIAVVWGVLSVLLGPLYWLSEQWLLNRTGFEQVH